MVISRRDWASLRLILRRLSSFVVSWASGSSFGLGWFDLIYLRVFVAFLISFFSLLTRCWHPFASGSARLVDSVRGGLDPFFSSWLFLISFCLCLAGSSHLVRLSCGMWRIDLVGLWV